MFFFIKVLLSAAIIGIASEIARWNKLLSALIISLPIISILSFIWIYLESRDQVKIVDISQEIFWLSLLSSPFFLILNYLLKHEVHFWLALSLSCISLFILYWIIIHIRSYQF